MYLQIVTIDLPWFLIIKPQLHYRHSKNLEIYDLCNSSRRFSLTRLHNRTHLRDIPFYIAIFFRGRHFEIFYLRLLRTEIFRSVGCPESQ